MATLAEPPGQRDEAPKPGGTGDRPVARTLTGRKQHGRVFARQQQIKRAERLASRVEQSKHMRADRTEWSFRDAGLAEMMLERNQG